jgi:hypothetical protein
MFQASVRARRASSRCNEQPQRERGIYDCKGLTAQLLLESRLQAALRDPIVDSARQRSAAAGAQCASRQRSARCQARHMLLIERCPDNRDCMMNGIADERAPRHSPPMSGWLAPDPLAGPIQRPCRCIALQLSARGKRDTGQDPCQRSADYSAGKCSSPLVHAEALFTCAFC